jgi:hypothetical protein
MTDLLIGHNLCNFDKKYLLFLQILLFMRGAFPNKSHLQGSLKLDTLNALMRVSLCNIEMDNMDWRMIFEVWQNMTNYRILILE